MSPAEPRARRRRVPLWLELPLLLVAAVLVSVVIKAFVAQVFFVPSASMQPLLRQDDRILVEKVSYWSGEVDRGDVVVFADPGGWLGGPPPLSGLQRALSVIGLYPTAGHLVKRVVAVGGDQVACCDGRGRVTVNGVPLDESDYLPRLAEPSQQRFSVTVPAGRLWVMGDNRPNSEDSRFHRQEDSGTIPAESVVGRVRAIIWPPGRMRLVARPPTYEQTPGQGFEQVGAGPDLGMFRAWTTSGDFSTAPPPGCSSAASGASPPRVTGCRSRTRPPG